MNGETRNSGLTFAERLILIIAIAAFGLYFINIFLGKASIHWGWNTFYLGNVGEFILLLVASIALIGTALHREHIEKSNHSNSL